MAYGVNLTQDPSTNRSLYDLQREAQDLRAGRAQLQEIETNAKAEKAIRDAMRRHTVIDARTGQTRTDHTAVANEIREIDPVAAETYTAKVTEKQKATEEANFKLLQSALAAVDENQEDQDAAAQQYASAVRMLESRGVPVSPEDRIYSRGKVQWLRRMAAGAEKTMSNDTDIMKHNTPSGNTVLQEEGNNNRAIMQEQGRNYRHDTPSGNTVLQEEEENYRATLPARSKPQEGSSEVSFLPAGVPVRVTSGVGPRKAPMKGASTNHRGTDYAAPAGTPILAEENGIVISSGEKGGYGNQVRVRYQDGRERSYSHADRLMARPGQQVIKGQPIATVGKTGTATGYHVHVEDHGLTPSSERVTGRASAQEDELPARFRSAVPERGQTRRPQRFAPTPRQGVIEERPSGDNVPRSDIPRIVAQGVLNYRGTSNLTRQGEISTRTHPQVKRLREVDVEGRMADLSRVVELLGDDSVTTGAGSSIMQMGRRGLQAFENLTGFDASSDANDNKAAAYELLQKTSTLGAIESLRGVGGNDTDKDFDRALATTVNTLRSKKANKEVAAVALGMLELGRDKLIFFERWANVAGSIQQSIDGVTVEEAWASVAAPRQRQIVEEAKRAGMVGKKSNTNRVRRDGGDANYRLVRDARGNPWRQYRDGRLVRDK